MGVKRASHWPITVTTGTAAIFNIFLPLALVRLLSPDQVGQYKVFFLYLMLSPGLFFVSGFTNGLYHWTGNYPETKPEVSQGWTLLMSVSTAFCLVGLLFARWLAPMIKLPVIDLHLLLLSAPLNVGSQYMEDLLIARGNIWTGSLFASGCSIFRLAAILAVAWWTRSVQAVIWVFALSLVFRTLVGWWLLAGSGDLGWTFSAVRSQRVFRYAFPVSVAGAASLANQYIDQMILSVRLTPAGFAFYSIGCLTVPPLEILATSVCRILIPRLSQSFATNNPGEAAALFSESVAEMFLFLLPATVGLAIYARPIIRILFTAQYMHAAKFLPFYAFVYLFPAVPFDAVARARGDGGWILRTSILFSVFCAPATWVAAGRWGAMGALIVVLCCQLVMRLYSLVYDRRCFGVSISGFIPLRKLTAQTLLVMAAAASSILMRPLFSEARVWFLATGPLFTLVYFGSTYAFFLRKLSRETGPVHILELAQTVGLGGLERMIFSLSQSLNETQGERYKVFVAAYDHPVGMPSLERPLSEAGIPWVQWQKGRGFSIRSVVRLVRLIFAEKTRILHVHNLGPLIYGSIAKLLSLGRVRLVLTLHSQTDLAKGLRYQRYFKFFLQFADRIVAVSPNVKAALIALAVAPERIAVIPNGVAFPKKVPSFDNLAARSEARHRLRPNLPEFLYRSQWLLCLARLHPGKGQEVVLEVWSRLPTEARGDLALFFVGQETMLGRRQWLEAKILLAPDSDRIVLGGPSENPEEWIQSADLFISGSTSEGMPLAPLEAAGSGLPTVLTDIEGHQFLRPWAHFFDPRTPEKGAQEIVSILRGRREIGDAESVKKRWIATENLREQWSASVMVDRYAETFTSARVR